ncbi:MAG: hypothetical protein KAX99_09065 [Azonexus sp.]|jgi:hypothetical protein|nr:hypothetical protein [Azonexus sp.]
MFKKYRNKSDLTPPHAYAIAVLSAVLAGMVSIIVSHFNGQQAIAQKQMELRIAAYAAFLEKIDTHRAPTIGKLLSIGAIVSHVVTDSEIQESEDNIAGFLSAHPVQDLYWQLSWDFNILKVHGSTQVAQICKDILKALMLRDEEIDWSTYSSEVSKFHDVWKSLQEDGEAYGWEERISAEERLMIVTVAKLMEVLIQQFRLDTIQGGSAKPRTAT